MNAYVCCFLFAARFLIAGKRPILKLSTRAVLVAVLGLAVAYVLTEHSIWHAIVGAAALILNVVFIGFALIDFVNWQKAKTER